MIFYLKKGIPAIENRFWDEIEDLVLQHSPRLTRGRPRLKFRLMFSLILYYVRDGVPVKRLCSGFCSHQTFYNYLNLWTSNGLFKKIWKMFLSACKESLNWKEKFYLIDASLTKAIHGGEKTTANPTDRGKKGRKRSLITNQSGIPLSVVCGNASVHDSRLVEENVKALIFRPKNKIKIYADKGYIGVRISDKKFELEVESRKNMKIKKKIKGIGKKRWPIERTHSWMNNFRAIKLSLSRSIEVTLNFIHIACIEICWNFCQNEN